MANTTRSRLDKFGDYMTLPDYERGSRAAWYSLIDAEQRSETAFRKHLTARVDEKTARDVQKIQEEIPGLSVSAACRLLIVLGLENYKAVQHYAPEVVSDAVRNTSSPLANSSRLASMVCPLTAAAMGELSETIDERAL